jgi:TusA-related sulfurtransferase
MLSVSQLDLQEIAWPVCLLQFKQNLLSLEAGNMLEVLVQDPEVADQIAMIVDRSVDRLIARQKDGDRVRLWIVKGKRPDRGNMLPMVLPPKCRRGNS